MLGMVLQVFGEVTTKYKSINVVPRFIEKAKK